MSELALLLKTRSRTIFNQLTLALPESKLKIAVISFAIVGFWWVAFQLFRGGFFFLRGFPDMVDWLTGYLFALFFFALTLMLIISNVLISYMALYKSQETSFLISMPFKAGNIFLYNLSGSLVFSSWSFIFLGMPLIIAYGINRHLAWEFYPVAFGLFGLFVFIPAGLGALLALLIARFFPRTRRQLVILIIGLIIIGLIFLFIKLSAIRHIASPFSERWVYEILNKLAFCQNPLFPGYWITQAIMASAIIM